MTPLSPRTSGIPVTFLGSLFVPVAHWPREKHITLLHAVC